MAYNDLRDWINTLQKAGELKRITQEVDPILEMAEIADRAAKLGRGTAKAGGPALLFENVKGYPKARVLMNQFGRERRMKLALETDSLDDIADRIRTLIRPETPTSFMDKLKMLPKLAEVGSFFPKVISAKDAACKEVIHRGEEVDLNELPILKTWPQDGGRFITLPCVVTRDPKSGKRNVGMYRMQVYDSHTTGMHWQRQKVAAEHLRERLRATTPDLAGNVDLMAITSGGTAAAASLDSLNATTLAKIRGDRMEVAVAIGTDPATTFSAIIPAPPDVEEYLIAGFLRQKPVELVKAETVDLEVPAHAEYILEGYVELGELRTEGPFGDHTGFYTMQDDYPVFHITCITHRGIWAMGQAMFTKCIIVVDEDCDVQDLAEVTLRTANNIDPERDIQFTLGPVDSLDHASRLPNYGSKMGIDATRKWPAEGFNRPWPPMLTMDAEVKARVDALWKKLGIE